MYQWSIMTTIHPLLLEGPDLESWKTFLPDLINDLLNPFNTNTVCNDQIVVGTKKSMSIYFQFPKNIFSPQPNTMSVEELLREYLRQQNLNLQTFKWTYTKHL